MLKNLSNWLTGGSKKSRRENRTIISIGVFGEINAGKSDLFHRLNYGKYSGGISGSAFELYPFYCRTSNKKYLINAILYNNIIIRHSPGNLFALKSAKANILVLDLEREDGIVRGEELIKTIKSSVPYYVEVPLIIIGAKADGELKVARSEALDLRDKLGALAYIETSAKLGINVDEALCIVAACAMKYSVIDDRPFGEICRDLGSYITK